MQAFIRTTVALFSLTVLSLFSIGIHNVTTMPMMASHTAASSHHETVSSPGCLTLCKTAIVNKVQPQAPQSVHEDQPQPWYVLASPQAQFALSSILTLPAGHLNVDRPPPKVASYLTNLAILS